MSDGLPRYRDIAARYADAWNRHDLHAIMALHAEDTRYRLYGEKQAYVGRDAVAKKFAQQLAAIPDIHFALKSLHGGAGHFVFQAGITYTGKTGETVCCDGIDLITLRDGLVVDKDSYILPA